MKKMAVFGMLFLFMCFSCFAQNTKKTKKVKALIEKVNSRLDSIIQNQPYEVIHGDRYYRFKEGVFTVHSDTIVIGAFSVLDRVHFTSHDGEITFQGIDEDGEAFTKTLEQLLFALGKD